ncbi:Hypothetical protein PHPALM_13757, partial [Phytophthora palmivora]
MPQFISWLGYVDDFKTKHPETDAAVMPIMLSRYDDNAVSKMLETAKKTSSTKNFAIRLQEEQFNWWLSKKIFPDDVFKALELDKAGETILSNPQLYTWMEYVTIYNKKNPGRKATMIAPLYARNNGIDADMIIWVAMVSTKTTSIAKQLQAESLELWLRMRYSPRRVFTMLGLGKAGDNFLSNPNFRTWTKYLNDFNKQYPDTKTNPIHTLIAYYGDDALSDILAGARKNPDTEKIATNLQRSLLNAWVRELKDPTEVSKLLKVD